MEAVIPIAFGYRRSCCNRRAWPRFWGTTSGFYERFPTVEALAHADLQDVLAAWSGLGYYRRARAMHAAAVLVAQAGGEFPSSIEDLRLLPGIGRYTAAAIASIAFGLPAAVLDGNVERVLNRLHGRSLGKEELWSEAGKLLSPERPGDWNQAMMELGATDLHALRPNCGECPLRSRCATRGEGAPAVQLPRKKKELTYGLVRRGRLVRLVQRSAKDSLMAGMWELPELQSAAVKEEVLAKVKHSITDTDYAVTVIRAGEECIGGGRWVTQKQLNELPLTGLTRKILRKLAILPESEDATSESKQ